MKNVLLISPSRSFIERLPYGKIPERSDFKNFRGRNNERLAFWKKVINENERLGDEFYEAAQTGRISELVKPMP